MSAVAILGAGPLGAAIAQRLAERERVRSVRMIDPAAGVAAGKALDLRQAGAITRVDTIVAAGNDVLDAVGADVVVFADAVDGGEWRDDPGLDLCRQLVAAGSRSALVFAGASQVTLMEAVTRELGVAADRVVGTCASAAIGTVQALVAAEVDGAGRDVAVALAGRPPDLVIAWTSATLAGAPISDVLAPPALRAIAQALAQLWPPGPQAIAAATAPVVEALAGRARRRYPALTVLDGQLGPRGTAAMMPLTLGHRRILERHPLPLSPLERTGVISSLRP